MRGIQVAAADLMDGLDERTRRVRVEGHRQYNPGWHLALDLQPLLAVSECIARAALERTESRGAQTREDYPETDYIESVVYPGALAPLVRALMWQPSLSGMPARSDSYAVAERRWG